MKFNFKWPGKNFDKVAPNVIEIAKKLLELNLIKVDENLNDEGCVVIRHTGVCRTDGLVECISSSLVEENLYSYTFSARPNVEIDGICRGRKKDSKYINCKMSSCPIWTAGYLYYLNNKEEENEEEASEVLRELTETEKHERNLNELKNMNFDEELEEFITPLALPSVRGLRVAFVGEEGTDKDTVIKKIASYLHRIGKITETSARERTLLEVGDKDFDFRSDALYVISDIQEYLSSMNNNDDFSSNAENDRKKNKNSISKIIHSRGKYLILNTTPEELKKFLATNSKLPYIFDETIYFKDYDDEKLLELFESNLPAYHKDLLNDEGKQLFLSYLERNRKYFPFKNADLSMFLSGYVSRKKELILPKERFDNVSLEDMFNSIIGMDNVKNQIKELHSFLYFRKKLEKNNVKLPDFNLHMLFLGNPGTGKTMVARLIAKTLYDLGYIRENKCIEVETKDLIAAYTGQTALKTGRVINSALGGVLFIDEAYALAQSGGNYGLEAIATLVKAMEDNKGDLVVIFAGYSKEMQEFINANSGIQSRIGYTFEFADYSEEELYKIFELKANNANVKIQKSAEKKIKELINYGKNRKNFGNGRYVDNLLQKTLIKHASVIKDEKDILKITDKSIPEVDDVATQASGQKDPEVIEKIFDDIIGLDTVKNQVIDLGKYLSYRKEMSKLTDTRLPDMRMHMLFVGNSGTGKTMMARKLAEMLYNLGCIRINKVIEVDRKDLVGEFVGQTAPKTQRVIESALGGVLFIDEAYSLAKLDNFRDFGTEAIATLMKAMEDYRDELVVVFAGYKKEMKDFMNANSGLKSRIGYTFEFEDYKPEELYSIFELKCKKYNLIINEEVKSKVMDVLKYFASVENYGNGRFVDKLLQEILIKHASLKLTKTNINVLEVSDVPSINEMAEKVFGDMENLIIPSDITTEDRRKIAIHELGHAIISYLYKGESTLKIITVVPEATGTLGYVLHTNPKSKVLWTKRDYLDEIEVSLAGRAAEELFLGKDNITSGCVSDLEKASKKISSVVTEYGMSDTIGLLSVRGEKLSLEMMQKLDIEKKILLDSCYQNVLKVLKEHEFIFNKVLETLMEKGTMTGEEFVDLIKEN